MKRKKKLKYILLRNQLLAEIIILLLGVLIVNNITLKNLMYYVAISALFLIVTFMVWYIQIIKVKKIYNSDYSIIKKYTFLENHFEEASENEKRYIYYHDINRIIENKTALYIMISTYNWIIIKKENASNDLLKDTNNLYRYLLQKEKNNYEWNK